jgi:hypothetical protein
MVRHEDMRAAPKCLPSGQPASAMDAHTAMVTTAGSRRRDWAFGGDGRDGR